MLQLLIKRLKRALSRNQMMYIIFLYVLLNSFGLLGIYFFEYGKNEAFQSPWDIVWFTTVTSTTVGYGDKFPITVGGQLVTMVIMIFGIGILGLLLGEFSSRLVERRLRHKMGELPTKQDQHILILGWNYRGNTMIKEILADGSNIPITILAPLSESPLSHPNIWFVKGNPSQANDLEKAGIHKAKSALLLADQKSEEDQFHDAKTVLVALAVRKANPSLRMSAEVIDPENVIHLKNAGVKDCIVTSEIGSHLLVRSAFYESTYDVVHELLTNHGNEIITISIPLDWQGYSFKSTVDRLMTDWQSIPIGVVRNGQQYTNPSLDFGLHSGDKLILITSQEERLRQHFLNS